MKPSHDEQRIRPAQTDQKFRVDDTHLVAKNKEDVAMGPHGDKVVPNPGEHAEDRESDVRSKA